MAPQQSSTPNPSLVIAPSKTPETIQARYHFKVLIGQKGIKTLNSRRLHDIVTSQSG